MREDARAATTPATDARGEDTVPAVSGQLAAIRDEWLPPLVDRITALERGRGRLEAEQDEQRRRAEAAEREREEMRRRDEALRASADFREPSAPPAAPARRTSTSTTWATCARWGASSGYGGRCGVGSHA